MNTYRTLTTAALCAAAIASFTTAAQAQRVVVAEPGLYGRVDMAEAPPGALIYGQPVVIEQNRYAGYRRPIYLHVPLGYERDWAHHCYAYGACGQPVYFVQDGYYREHFYHPVARAIVRDDRWHREHDHPYR